MTRKGFTLSELLIALAILGVIATFTIPKVLQSQQNTEWKAKAKETAAMIAGAYDAYKLKNQPTGSMKPTDLLPYFNYVKFENDGTVTIDDVQTGGTSTCDNTDSCILLHNGGRLLFWDSGGSFGGTASTNVISFDFDPDGKVTGGGPTGPGKSVNFALYFNGRLATRGTLVTGSASSVHTPFTVNPAYDPPWFSWD